MHQEDVGWTPGSVTFPPPGFDNVYPPVHTLQVLQQTWTLSIHSLAFTRYCFCRGFRTRISTIISNGPFVWAPPLPPIIAHTIAQYIISLRLPFIAIYVISYW